MNRRSLIMGGSALIGLLVGWPFRKILLGVAVGLAVGSLIVNWTTWFGGRPR